MDDDNYLIKTLLIGDSSVGKSCIVSRFVNDCFYDTHMCTIGVDYKTINIVHNENKIKFLIWDTAGQERFRSITKIYYKGSNCVIIVFDLTNKHSFDNVINWLSDLENIVPKNIIKILVGNKSDESDETNVKKCIEYNDALEFCNEHGILHYFETSAKNNHNIDNVFYKITDEFVKHSKLYNLNNSIKITRKNSMRTVSNNNNCC